MISLEMARKLKEAGLVWEPKTGDWFYRKDGAIGIVIDVSGGDWWAVFPPDGKEVAFCIEEADGFIFDPRLDQLLAEIEKRGWKYTLISRNMNGANEDCLCWVVKWAIPTAKRGLYGVTPADAAASALLWIYEGRAKA